MKKLVIILSVLFITAQLSFAGNDPINPPENKSVLGMNSYNDHILSGGLYIRLGGILPNSSYMYPAATSARLGTRTPGGFLELGTYFPFNNHKTVMVGMDITWLDVGATKYEMLGTDYTTLEASFIKLGPFVSVKLMEDMAVDASIQINPTVAADMGYWEDGAFGVGYETGLQLRYQFYSLGFKYIGGHALTFDYFENSASIDASMKDYYRLSLQQLRITLGVKFSFD
jgi:hypothetical protein